jgi:hypothetical protein
VIEQHETLAVFKDGKALIVIDEKNLVNCQLLARDRTEPAKMSRQKIKVSRTTGFTGAKLDCFLS